MTAFAELALSVVSATPYVTMNLYEVPFNVGFGVVKSGAGDITFTVQHTFDDFQNGATATAFDHSEVSGKTGTVDGNYAYPVRGIRLNVTAVSGAATATLKVLQAGV